PPPRHRRGRTAAGTSPRCARADTAVIAAADPIPSPETARFSPGPRAGATRAATATTGSPAPRRPRLRVAVVAAHGFHEGLAPPRLEDPRALHDHLLALDEVLAPVTPDAGVDVRIHADGIARTRFHAHPTVDALQGVDLVAHRVLLDGRVGVLAGLDVNALRRAGGGAQEARRAAHRAVGLERQPVRPAVALRVLLPLLGVLHRHHSAAVLGETEEMERVDRHVAHEMTGRDRHAAYDLGQI